MSDLRSIAKNSAVLVFSDLFAKALGFFQFVIMARYLGASGFGTISFALALGGILIVFCDLGLTQLSTRDISRNPSLSSRYIGSFFVLRLVVALMILAVLVLGLNLSSYGALDRAIIAILFLSLILNQLTYLPYATFQAFQRMEWQSLGQALYSLAMFIGVVIAVYLGLSIMAIALVYLASAVILLLYSYSVMVRRFTRPRFAHDRGFWKASISEAYPYAVNSIFITIYLLIGSVLISFFWGSREVGLYNAAYSLITALYFVPLIAGTVLFPLMSRYFVDSKEALQKMQAYFLKYMVIVAVPMAISITSLAPQIIGVLYGQEYQGSVVVLQIMAWFVALVFVVNTFDTLLNASNRQRTLMKVAGFCTAVNILLNLVMIPTFGIKGAALSAVVGEATGLTLSFYLSRDLRSTEGFYRRDVFVRIALAGGLMAAIILIFPPSTRVVAVGLGLIAYIVAISTLKVLSSEDYRMMRSVLGREKKESA